MSTRVRQGASDRTPTLLSFERPHTHTRVSRASMELENCTMANIELK